MTTSTPLVLLSVKPEHASRLLDGTKSVELRRRLWRVPPNSLVLLYASGGTRGIVGTVVVEDTDSGSPDDIWRRYGDQAAVSREAYDEYFSGASQAVAIRICSPRRLGRTLTLNELRKRRPTFTAPQSFRYLAPTEVCEILNGEREALGVLL